MSYVYLSDLNPNAPAAPTTPDADAARAQAIESQAKDLKATAKVVEASNPGLAAGLKAQSDALFKAAEAFRQARGLPDPATFSTTTKIALAAGTAVLLGVGVKAWQARKTQARPVRFNASRGKRCSRCRCKKCKC